MSEQSDMPFFLWKYSAKKKTESGGSESFCCNLPPKMYNKMKEKCRYKGKRCETKVYGDILKYEKQ